MHKRFVFKLCRFGFSRYKIFTTCLIFLDNGKIWLQLLSRKKHQSKLKTKALPKNKLIIGLKLKSKTITKR